jgi:hypothetical protein
LYVSQGSEQRGAFYGEFHGWAGLLLMVADRTPRQT